MLFIYVQENKDLFDVNESSKSWKNYVEFVDEMVTNGLLALIQQNLQFFLISSTPSASKNKPVFMIHVYVDDQKGLLFKPPLFQPVEESVQGLVEDIIDGIFQVAALFPRINTDHPQKQYIVSKKLFLNPIKLSFIPNHTHGLICSYVCNTICFKRKIWGYRMKRFILST